MNEYAGSSGPYKGLSRVIVSAALVYAVLLAALLLRGGPGPVVAVLPWFIPLVSLFQALIHGSIAFLAVGRSKVLGDPASFWIGMGSAGFAVSMGFYALAWPGLLPNGESLIASLPGTPAWFLQIGLALLGVFLLMAVPVRPPLKGKLGGGRLLLLATGGGVSLVVALTLVLRAEGYLPALVTTSGMFTPLLLAWNAAAGLLFAGGAFLSARRHLQTGDPLLGYIALSQAGFAFVIFATLGGMRRYDLWWYLLRAIITASGLVVFFGLLSEYVRLFRSERDKAEQLRIAKGVAEEASRAKDVFLVNMSHELRTPLAISIGNIELAMQTEGVPEEAKEYLATAADAEESLLVLIQQILELRSLQEKKAEVHRQPMNLADCCRPVGERFLSQAERKGVNFTWRCADDLPARVLGDCDKVRQVLGHLIGNAVKFTEKGGEVRFTADLAEPIMDETGWRVRFRVRDTGIGMRTEMIDRLFLPFSQGDTSLTRKHGGAGLGLAISKGLIEEMGGEIRIQSEEGKGTLVSFILPFPGAPDPGPEGNSGARRL